MSRRPPSQLLTSVCRPALLLLVLAALFPSAAFAAPEAPTLLETNPVSPGASLTPSILGRPSGRIIIFSWTGGQAETSAPQPAGADLDAEITIYTNPDCSGSPVAIGTGTELETSGIPVSVAPDSITDFYATQTETGGTSPCSSGIEYRQVTGPPPTPVVSSVDPPGPAGENEPLVLGTAADGATVSLYSDPDCTGPALGTGGAATFAAPGIQVTVADNSTTTFHATASWAGMTSACSSSSVTYQEVTATPPATSSPGNGTTTPSSPAVSAPTIPSSRGALAVPTLHTVPGGRANDLTPLLVAVARGASRIEVFGGPSCQGPGAISGSAAELAAGVAVPVAPNATTTFSAAAVGATGRSHCSSPVAYTEDSLPPRTRITMGPAARTRRHKAVFRFADITEDPPGTTFRCKVNKAKWKPCASPLRLSHLKPRRYVVRIRATDLAGNVERKPVKRRFTVGGRSSRGRDVASVG